MAAGLSALNQVDELKKQVTITLESKLCFLADLRKRGFVVEDTDANFILVNLPDSSMVAAKLKDMGIIVRLRPGIRAASVLRVTVGSNADNVRLVAALEEIMSE